MKIRTGFVSNSSTTSFLCWGVELKDEEGETDYDEDKDEEILRVNGVELKYGEFCKEDDKIYIGANVYIGTESDEEFDLEEMKEMAQKVLDKVGIKRKIKLYTGPVEM